MIQPGAEFYFQGDWQTSPGRWRVIEERHNPRTYYCEPIDGENYTKSEFWAQVVEDCIKRSQ